jgi:hypothetical protein
MMSQQVPDTYAKIPAQLGALSVSANHVDTHIAPQLQNGLSDPLLQHGEYPGLTAGAKNWAFQDVDLAFFESLMRSTGNEGGEDAEWAMWQR